MVSQQVKATDYAAAGNARLTMQNGSTCDAGDKYRGLDRFDRPLDADPAQADRW